MKHTIFIRKIKNKSKMKELKPISLNEVHTFPFKSPQDLISYASDKKKILIAVNAEKILHATEETKKVMSKLASERTDRPRGARHWNYGKKTSDLSKQKMSISQTLGNNGFAKKVIDLNTNIVYSCISEAKQVYNISHSFISMVCTGKRKSDKYNFKYLKDYEQEKCLTVNF